jgi:hypothetical protein
VTSVGGDSFTVVLIDQDTEEEINADMYLRQVAENDLDLLAPGALFYWTINDDHTSVVTFRRTGDDHDPT